MLSKSLTLFASFDEGFSADYSRGDKGCYLKQGSELVPCVENDEAKIVKNEGRFGSAIHFPNKGTTRPLYSGKNVLGYNADSWSASVSLWLRLNPDEDLEPGRGLAAANAVLAKGATIRYRDDQLGYLRVLAPVAQAENIAKLNDVLAVEVNEVVPLPDPEPEGVVGIIPQAVPNAATPKDNPYMPIEDIGGASFMAANPTWDGRDVRIGIVDSGVTLDHPSLQTTSTGLRKILDWKTFTDPLTDGDPTWINMAAQVKGPSFTYNAVTYTAPANKTYRIGLFNERVAALGGEVGSDVNRDGNPTGSNGIFAVLWDVSKGEVWVDTNQNNSFADDMKMKEYDINYDVNYFGTDNPATAVAGLSVPK